MPRSHAIWAVAAIALMWLFSGISDSQPSAGVCPYKLG